jgi:hypothetical protein
VRVEIFLFCAIDDLQLIRLVAFSADKLPGMPHGFVLGTASNGVIGYNCNYQHILPGDKSYDQLNYVKDARGKLQYSGDKWQCVEYARRTWITELDVYLPNTPRACDIWDRLFVKRLSDNARVSLLKYTSGVTHHRPAVNDLIIWKKTDEQPYGHVAVVSEVTDHRIRIAEQNADNDVLWTHGHFSREFKLSHDSTSGAWTMHDEEDPLFGWVRVDLENVADALPWSQPEEDVTGVDGQYGTCMVLVTPTVVYSVLNRNLFVQARALPSVCRSFWALASMVSMVVPPIWRLRPF